MARKRDDLGRFVSKRPAETTSLTLGVVVSFVVHLLHVRDPELIADLPLIVGAIPAGVTWVVATLRRRDRRHHGRR